MDYPKLRNVEAFPIEQDGQRFACLRDPTNLTPNVLILPLDAFGIVQTFDGENSIADIQAACMRQFGELIYGDDIRALIKQLDDAHMLEGPAFEEYREAIELEFLQSDVRESLLSGKSYPAEPEELECELSSLFLSEDGPGEVPKIGVGDRKKGAVLPHIDLERGAKCYARGWAAAAMGCYAKRFIVIGTGHFGLERPLSLTSKDFRTPLGLVKTDKSFVESLRERLGDEAFADEFAHRAEHSIELQLPFIQYLFGNDIEIVPVISVAREKPAWGDDGFISPLASDFVSAVLELIDEASGETFVIASADLAHVGPRFGDQLEISPTAAEALREKDLELLETLGKPDIAAFADAVQSDGNARNICGFMPILLAAAITGGRFELVDYSQAFDPMATVTFASMTIA